jgi:hypothetical protein
VRSDDGVLQFDTILFSVGTRYGVRMQLDHRCGVVGPDTRVHVCVVLQVHGSFVGRTYFVNPSDAQKAAYGAALDVQQDFIDHLRIGDKVLGSACVLAVCVCDCVCDCECACGCDCVIAAACVCVLAQISNVVTGVVDRVRAKRDKVGGGFIEALSRNFGAGIGIVPVEPSLALTADNETFIKCVAWRVVRSHLSPAFHQYMCARVVAGPTPCSMFVLRSKT